MWRTLLLGDVCDILDSMRKPITKRDRVPGPHPYYGATGVQDYVEGYLFDEKLVLVGEDGAKWGANENSAFIAEGRYWVNNHAHVLRPHRQIILDEWLVYFLNHADLMPFVTGLTVPKLNQAQLRSVPVLVPPLAEQKRIVAILDEAFEGIRIATANAEKNLANARELFETELDSVVSSASGEAVKLGAVTERVTVGHVGTTSPYYRDSGVLFLRTQNVTSTGLTLDDVKFVTAEFHAKLKKSALQQGDVLISRVITDRVSCGVVPAGIGDANCANVILVRPGKRVMPNYLQHFIRARSTQKFLLGKKVGSAQSVVNTSVLHDLTITLPTRDDQELLLEKIDLIASHTDRLAESYGARLSASNEFKQSILSRAFAGQLTAAKELAA
jgi:type I restriction enzyme S subunit